MNNDNSSGGGFGGMEGFLAQAQQLQVQLQQEQQEIKSRVFEGTSGGGQVVVKMYGTNEIKELTISPEVINPQDPEMLQDLVKAALNQANNELQKTMDSAVGRVTGGIKIPGLF